MRAIIVTGALIFTLCTLAYGKTNLPVYYAEPGYAGLKPGTKALVDDRSCPAGQIKEVTGGNIRTVPITERKKRCIKDPR